MKINTITRIVIFYVIGIIGSNIIRFNLLNTDELFNNLSIWSKIFTIPLQSIGVFIGSLVAIYLLRKKRNTLNSFLGTSPKWSLLMGIIPIIVFGIIGIENTKGLNEHYLGLIMGIAILIYCIFEEYGWRGYLEDELINEKEWKRVLIISILWYFWHLSFINNPDLLPNLKFFGIILLGTWGIGKVIQSTKSVLSVSCFHMIYNILILKLENEGIIGGDKKILIIGICIIGWIIIIKLWEREKNRKIE